jgi:uncharacterized membrane protein YkoI
VIVWSPKVTFLNTGLNKESKTMDRKRVIIAATVIGVGVIVGGIVWSYDRDKLNGQYESHAQQPAALAMGAKIAIDQAMKIALDNFPGQVIEVELEKNGDRMLWDVDVLTAEQGVMVVRVDAESGSVIMTGEKSEGKSRDRKMKQKS